MIERSDHRSGTAVVDDDQVDGGQQLDLRDLLLDVYGDSPPVDVSRKPAHVLSGTAVNNTPAGARTFLAVVDGSCAS